MKLNPVHARHERRDRELVELEAFRTVRRVADEELRELASVAPTSPEVAAARTALASAATAEEVVAVEPLVRRAESVVGVDVQQGRTVRIADRWIAWTEVGASYAGVLAALRDADAGSRPAQRGVDTKHAQWDDQGRGFGAGGGAAG